MSEEEKTLRKQARMKLRKEEAEERRRKEEEMANVMLFLAQERASADRRTKLREVKKKQARRDKKDAADTKAGTGLKMRRQPGG